MALNIDWENLPVHEAAALLATMNDAQVAELAEDIKANGLQSPITLWRDNRNARPGIEGAADGELYLLDGRARLAAIRSLGVSDPNKVKRGEVLNRTTNVFQILKAVTHASPMGGGKPTVLEDTDPFDYFMSVNIQRRTLTLDEKRQAAVRYKELNPTASNRKISLAVFGTITSDKTVKRAIEEARAAGLVRDSEIPNSGQMISEMVAENPQASVREIAAKTGVAKSTVQDAMKKAAAMAQVIKAPDRTAQIARNGAAAITAIKRLTGLTSLTPDERAEMQKQLELVQLELAMINA